MDRFTFVKLVHILLKMKYYILLLTIGLALASPVEEYSPIEEDNPSTRIYPEIITDIPYIEDASAMDFDELLQMAASHAGLEWLKDEKALAQAGIDVRNIHPDIIADAFSTTVRINI